MLSYIPFLDSVDCNEKMKEMWSGHHNNNNSFYVLILQTKETPLTPYIDAGIVVVVFAIPDGSDDAAVGIVVVEEEDGFMGNPSC